MGSKSKNINGISVILLLLIAELSFGQTGTIHGTIRVDNNVQEFAMVHIVTNTELGDITDRKGKFNIEKIPFGTYDIIASYVGYEKKIKTITITKNNQTVNVSFNLSVSLNILNEIVVTGTRTAKRQIDSPVIVNVINSQTLDNVQACNLAEGLRFQPGLRVENNCQTCNYTQLRINGLAGGYSQILINGRPIFSPLTGLYGLEQLPSNMIERIEVIKGGASSLYGSRAIGGTVNVITKVPTSNSFEVNSFYQNINGQSNDFVLSGNASLVAENKKSGISFFFNNRERDFYDHNNDNFSELPLIKNTSVGTSLFFLPNENQKLEINISNINEYRFGGEMVDKPAFLTLQSEERTTSIWTGSVDYQINFNNDNSSLISYVSFQNTDREHYTGIFPDDSVEIQSHFENPPYGISNTTSLHGGFQLNHKIHDFLGRKNTFTFGSEYLKESVFDEIATYNFLVDQTTEEVGVFVQSDWELLPSLTLLSGVRMDKHNMIDNLVFNPSASLLYKYKENTQFRVNYGTGFRAPQAFDTDLHIAFAGGGVSRISLSPDLKPEFSKSFSASINYDKPMDNFIAGFTLEGFHTRLNDAFFLQPIGEDNFGELFEKQNGQGATVQGVTLELRANYEGKVQLETGFTLQSSLFDEKVEYIYGLEGIREFVRTPDDYGFATLSITPNNKFSANLNYIYTGKMSVPHFAGAPNQLVDEIITSNTFSELNIKLAYTIQPSKAEFLVELYGGVKNILNSYQNEFDTGKNRDSNFVFGPALPRTLFVGIKLRSN